MPRSVNIQVTGYAVQRGAKNAGVQGEANVTTLHIALDESWRTLSKKIVWRDANGENPTAVLLYHDVNDALTETDPLNFDTLIPAEPLAVAGWCSFTLCGYLSSNPDVIAYTATDTLYVLPNDSDGTGTSPAEPTPSQALQLQAEIDAVMDDVNAAVATAVSSASDSASAAALSASGAATAKTAAETAQGLAEAAQTAAETAQGTAETAASGAEASASAAATAKAGAETAQGAAETAQAAAETAETGAETAQSAAEAAQGAAETAQAAAEQAESDALSYMTAAAAAKADAETAQAAAETAQTGAETAQAAAETAQGLAVIAQGAAETAQAAAETAQAGAEAAQSAAETAQGAAETAEANAETAQAAAETAESHAESAASSASTSAATATTKAGEAAESAVSAASSASTASTAAGTATTKASEAFASAGSAATSESNASASESNAKDSAEDSEAWAVGKRDGADVPSTDPAYHNNAKWYKDQAEAIVGGDYATKTEAQGYVSAHDAEEGAHAGLFGSKVDKVSGKGLSTNDYTTAEMEKLAGVEPGAQVNVTPTWDSVAGKPDAFPPASHTHGKTDLSAAVQASLEKADSALQSESDPTVPSWAKAETKPSYTYSEVGADAAGAAAAVQGNLSTHAADTVKHITAEERSAWNSKQDAITTLPVTSGGTGAGTAAGARANLGVGAKPLVFENVSVPVSAWAADTTYTDWGYRAAVACTGVTAGMVPMVVLSPADATGGNFAPVAACYTGGVYIYAKAVPDAAITLLTILCTGGA